MKADYVHKDTRTIVVDGVEIQTSLTAVEIASLQQENQELKEKLNCDLKWAFKYDELYQENKKLKEQQKEFIEYLEEPIRMFEQGNQINISEYTSVKLDILEEVLLKYKEIIGEEE